MALCMHVTRYSRGHGLLYAVACMSLTMKALAAAAWVLHWSGIIVMLYEVMSWLCFGYVTAVDTAAASARRETVLWLPCQSGETKRVSRSYSSLSLLPAS